MVAPRARTAVVLGVIGLFVTVVPSVIALVMARNVKRQVSAAEANPATLAAAGRAKVLGIIGLFSSALFTLFVVLGALGTTGSASSSDYTRLQPGDCFNRTPSGSTVSIQHVSCAKAHNAEAVGRIIVPAGPWPGQTGFVMIVGSTCDAYAQPYMQDGVSSNVIVTYIYPERQAWDDGSRVVVCDVRTADGSKVNGPIGGGATAT
ncbi:MAG: septum formation family protein [Actinomycetota bacterium]|nr:septum formation family protein [Actinomycetota bacterium]